MSNNIEVKSSGSTAQIILDGNAADKLDADVVESVVFNYMFDPADDRTASLIEEALNQKYHGFYISVGISQEIDNVIIGIEAKHFDIQ
jgi:hypothetical protein